MKKIIIRKMLPDEASTVNTIFTKILSTLDYYNDIAKENERKRYIPNNLIEKIKEDEYSVAVAVDSQENKIIGFCFSRKDDYTIWLEWFAVIEEYRRQGIGKLFLQYLEDTAPKRDAHKIWCDSRANNTKSINLLNSFGYEKIALVERHWYKQDFILWHKYIDI